MPLFGSQVAAAIAARHGGTNMAQRYLVARFQARLLSAMTYAAVNTPAFGTAQENLTSARISMCGKGCHGGELRCVFSEHEKF